MSQPSTSTLLKALQRQFPEMPQPCQFGKLEFEGLPQVMKTSEKSTNFVCSWAFHQLLPRD